MWKIIIWNGTTLGARHSTHSAELLVTRFYEQAGYCHRTQHKLLHFDLDTLRVDSTLMIAKTRSQLVRHQFHPSLETS